MKEFNKKYIDSIISYVVESEMEGEIDKEDSWYPLIELLEDLKEKIKEEEWQGQGIVKEEEGVIYDDSYSDETEEDNFLT